MILACVTMSIADSTPSISVYRSQFENQILSTIGHNLEVNALLTEKKTPQPHHRINSFPKANRLWKRIAVHAV